MASGYVYTYFFFPDNLTKKWGTSRKSASHR
jgi:hypothetical protein